MLTPRQLDDLPLALIELYSQVEQDIVADAARRIIKCNYFTETAKWQFLKLQEMGNFRTQIMQSLAAQTGKSQREIARLFVFAGGKALAFDDSVYKAAGLNPYPIAQSRALQAVITEGIRKTNGLFKNLTATIAGTATKQFENALDRAYLQVISGAFSPQTAARWTLMGLASEGLRTVRYPSGHQDHMDVAIRRAMLTGINQTAGQLQLTHASEVGSDLVQVTSHIGARPAHAAWQGRIFSLSGKSRKYPEFRTSTGYGTGDGLCGWNCRHNFYPFFEGLSVDTYKRYDTDENEKVYEQSQQQRAYERAIRKSKRHLAALDAAAQAAPDETTRNSLVEDFSRSAAGLKDQEQRLRTFLQTTNLARRRDREQSLGFSHSQSSKAVWAAKKR